jgi:hypothetical protein
VLINILLKDKIENLIQHTRYMTAIPPTKGTASNAYRYPSIKKKRAPILTPTLYNAAAKSMAFVIAGGIAFIFWPVLAPPLLTVACTIAATRLVIKISNIYAFKAVEKLQLKLACFRDKHKLIQVASVIAIVVVGAFCWQAACVIAVPFGIYAAVIIGLDYYKATQAVNQRQLNNGQQPAQGRKTYFN